MAIKPGKFQFKNEIKLIKPRWGFINTLTSKNTNSDNMKTLLRKLLKLTLSVEDQRILDALNSSKSQTKRVVGRGTLTVNVKDITSSAKFKEYSKLASQIVASQNS
jgi:hypothetical protein